MRENTDQNNSEYGYFLRSAYNWFRSHGLFSRSGHAKDLGIDSISILMYNFDILALKQPVIFQGCCN